MLKQVDRYLTLIFTVVKYSRKYNNHTSNKDILFFAPAAALDVYCAEHPESLAPHHSECSLYYNCSLPSEKRVGYVIFDRFLMIEVEGNNPETLKGCRQ